MKLYKYRAVNDRGRPVKGAISAADEVDLHNRLRASGLELIHCGPLHQERSLLSKLAPSRKINIRYLIQLFFNLEQMQSVGVPLLAALAKIRDTTDHDGLRDVISEIHQAVSEGSSLSETMVLHPEIFDSLPIALVASGEQTGDLVSAYGQIIKSLKWADEMQGKIRKATRYPIIVTTAVLVTVTVMLTVAVPQIVGFIRFIGQDLPFYTTALIATSQFFVAYWWAIVATPVLILIAVSLARTLSDELAVRLDLLLLNAPVIGPLIRKMSIARYVQTFGVLYARGIPFLTGLETARSTVKNLALVRALEGVQEQVRAGTPISKALDASGQFPAMVVMMLNIGEETGNLTAVLDQVADFYARDVDEAVQAYITSIEPTLTAVMGGMILWIAVAVFGPIYASFGQMQM